MITKFDEYINEGLLDQVRKLGKGDRENTKDVFLGRAIDNIQANKVFDRVKKDFEQNGKDLRKVMIIGDYKVKYVMGKFDIIKNSPMTGNFPDDKHKEEISFSFFKEGGLSAGKGRLEIDETIPNPNYDPELHIPFRQSPTEEEREKLAVISRNETSFKISIDVAKKVYDYFNDEYIKQYPQLKDAKNKNSWSIQEIEKGEKPKLGYVDIFDPEGTEIIYSYTDIKDKPKIEKYIKNNKCIKGKNKEHRHITYFTVPGESDGAIRDNMMNFTQAEVNKQNMERVYNYSK